MRRWLRKNNRLIGQSFKPNRKRKREKKNGEIKGSSKIKHRAKKGKEEVTRTTVILESIEPDEIMDPTSNPEEEVYAVRFSLDYHLEVWAHKAIIMSVLESWSKIIKNPHHRRFYLSFVYCSIAGFEFIYRWLRIPKKTIHYGRNHLSWYIPFLKEEFGDEKVEQWSESEILKKFNNTLDYIWHRYLAWKIPKSFLFFLLLDRLLELLDESLRILVRPQPIKWNSYEHRLMERAGKGESPSVILIPIEKEPYEKLVLELDRTKKILKERILKSAKLREALMESLLR